MHAAIGLTYFGIRGSCNRVIVLNKTVKLQSLQNKAKQSCQMKTTVNNIHISAAYS